MDTVICHVTFDVFIIFFVVFYYYFFIIIIFFFYFFFIDVNLPKQRKFKVRQFCSLCTRIFLPFREVELSVSA